MVYRAAWGSPIGFAFCDAAWYARELGRFPELLLVTIRGSRDGKHEERIVRDGNDYWQKFAISLNLDGFMKALEDWTLAFGYGLPFHGSEQLRYVLEEVDEPDAKAWLQLCLDEFPSALDGASAIQREMEKIQESERKREERRKAGRKPRPTPAFKEALQWGWLPRSLWGMSTSAIACELDPTIRDEGEATKASGRIRRDITALGYSASHRGEHQEALEREFFQKKDRSDSGL
ncbi:MAG: hypothetical protein H7A48_13905 [Akkermansiaceae bacterium]|nr:hypothetical protein [Akkermansiaceae bacterium]